jgi:uncharacterized protein
MRNSSLFSLACLLSFACSSAEPTDSASQEQSAKGDPAPDTRPDAKPDTTPLPSADGSACVAAGGSCIGLVPTACATGQFVANLCGNQIGASCCVPNAPAPQPDAGVCRPLRQSNGSANPASVYCSEMGYTLETVNDANGQSANCVFPDGTKCEQFSFFRGQCGAKHSFCARQGGVVSADSTTRPGSTIPMCDLPGGARCEEQKFSTTCVCQ